jgi:predicted permease
MLLFVDFVGFQSILEVFLLCLAGYILAWRRIIDKPTQRVRFALYFSFQLAYPKCR